MTEKISYGRRVGMILAVATLIALSLCFFSDVWIRRAQYPCRDLRDDWTIEQNGVLLPETRLPASLHTLAQKGDVLVLKTVLPDDAIPSAVVKVYIQRAVFDCYLDDALIYSYGLNYLERDGYAPYGYRLVPLPEDHAGKTLTLQYTAAERNAFSSIEAPLFGNVQDVTTRWISESRVVLFIGVFSALFGFILALLSFLMHLFFQRNLQTFAGGLIAVDMGAFALCYHHAFFVFTPNLYARTIIEDYTQFLFAIGVSVFLYSIADDRVERRLFGACAASSIAFALIGVLLQLLKFYPLASYLTHFQRFAFLVGAVLLVFGVRALRRRLRQYRRLRDSALSTADGIETTANLVLQTGIYALIFSVMIDLCAYQFTRYVIRIGDNAYSRLPSLIGMTIFAALLMVSYVFYNIGVVYARRRSNRLETLAYTDALTGLPNRAYVDRVLADLQHGENGYCVISIDVNYLKHVNDTKGHAAGDELLKNFSDVLRTTFRSTDMVGRMSGDEFIAILRDAPLNECIEKVRAMAEKLPFSVSYGCAHSSEQGMRNAHDVYKRADARMYEMKEALHKGAPKYGYA